VLITNDLRKTAQMSLHKITRFMYVNNFLRTKTQKTSETNDKNKQHQRVLAIDVLTVKERQCASKTISLCDGS
jgi:hypothetical protein